MRLQDGSRMLRMQRGGEIFYGKGAPGADMHPWYTTPQWWDPIEVTPSGGTVASERRGGSAAPEICVPGGWYAMVEPGFVNGLDPVVYGAPDIKVPASKGSPPRTPYQFGEKTKSATSSSRVPGLMDRVRVPLNGMRTYKVRTGQVVEYFRKFGYDPSKVNPVEISTGGANPTINANNLFSAGSTPWLGFCDIYLATARAGYELETSLGAFPITAIEYSVQFNDEVLQQYGTRARLMTGEMPKTPTAEERATARLLRKPLEDDAQDYLKISTVYILKTGDWGGDPDKVSIDGKNETAFVQHHCFWNLEHRARNRNPVNLPSMNAGLMFLPLIGRYGIAPIATASALESMANEIISAGLNAAQNTGKYWSV